MINGSPSKMRPIPFFLITTGQIKQISKKTGKKQGFLRFWANNYWALPGSFRDFLMISL